MTVESGAAERAKSYLFNLVNNYRGTFPGLFRDFRGLKTKITQGDNFYFDISHGRELMLGLTAELEYIKTDSQNPFTISQTFNSALFSYGDSIRQRVQKLSSELAKQSLPHTIVSTPDDYMFYGGEAIILGLKQPKEGYPPYNLVLAWEHAKEDNTVNKIWRLTLNRVLDKEGYLNRDIYSTFV